NEQAGVAVDVVRAFDDLFHPGDDGRANVVRNVPAVTDRLGNAAEVAAGDPRIWSPTPREKWVDCGGLRSFFAIASLLPRSIWHLATFIVQDSPQPPPSRTLRARSSWPGLLR